LNLFEPRNTVLQFAKKLVVKISTWYYIELLINRSLNYIWILDGLRS